jgi:hypothetical protein
VQNKAQSGSQNTLRETVKEALLSILSDSSASAAAKASAGRTLLEYFDERENVSGASGKRGAELTIEELDAEINQLSAKR